MEHIWENTVFIEHATPFRKESFPNLFKFIYPN